MRTRHRIPTIFNLSMVDVLCCALGCVILLWLGNLRAAKESADQAGQTDQLLATTQKELEAARAEQDATRKELETVRSEKEATQQELEVARTEKGDLEKQARSLKKQLAAATEQAAATRKSLQNAEEETRKIVAQLQTTQTDRDKIQAQLDKANKLIAALKEEQATAEQRLARQAEDYRGLEKKLTAAAQRVTTLESQLRDKEALASDSARRVKDLAERLSDAEERNKQLREDVKTYRDKFLAEEALAKALEKDIARRMKEMTETDKELQNLQAVKRSLEKDLEARDKDLATARLFRDKLAAAELRLQSLEKDLGERKKELAEAQRGVELLQGEKKALVSEVNRARAAADNRFAGIALTGKRVVFLVDMSGSMNLVDEQTAAPDKWTGVRETLAKIMKSLPDLEKFQVILFAEKTIYLLGQDERWLNYDPQTSVDQVVQALAAVKPRGGTNMYAALEAAFRYQQAGLDTIYLLSDGLPNIGEGLAPEAAKNLKETEKAEILSKYIRKKLVNDWNRAGAGRTRVRINAVGFFYESPDVGAFLWALARENEGSFVGMSKP